MDDRDAEVAYLKHIVDQCEEDRRALAKERDDARADLADIRAAGDKLAESLREARAQLLSERQSVANLTHLSETLHQENLALKALVAQLQGPKDPE